MTLTYSLRNAADLFAKLRRDLLALENQVTGDRLFNFVITGHHLGEWIDKDRSLAADARMRRTAIREDPVLAACRDLANASKHLVQGKKAAVRSATSAQGFGVGRFGKGPYGVGEESITLTLDGGITMDSISFCRYVLALYAYVFGECDRLPERGSAAT